MTKSRLRPVLAVLAGILLMAVAVSLSGCGEEPDPTWTPDPERTIQFLSPAPTATNVPVPTATPAPAPTATSAPMATPAPAPGDFALTVTTATTWGDAFSTFTGPQQDCIRDALGQPGLNSFLRKTIMTSEIDDYSNLPVPLFSCLDPERAGSLYAGILALHFERDLRVDLGDAEVSCLQVWAAGKDVPRLLADEEVDVGILDEISVCIAGPLETLIVAQIEQAVGELASEQEECLSEVMQRYRHLLFRSYVGAGEPEGEVQLMVEELAECVPQLFGDQDDDDVQEATRVISPTKGNGNLLEAHGIEPYLAGNLLFIAHWDEAGRRWLVYDVAGEFAPDQLTPPPGVAIPPDPEIGILTGLERGKLYDFHVRSDQIVNIVEGEMGDWHFNSGANFIEWSR